MPEYYFASLVERFSEFEFQSRFLIKVKAGVEKENKFDIIQQNFRGCPEVEQTSFSVRAVPEEDFQVLSKYLTVL